MTDPDSATLTDLVVARTSAIHGTGAFARVDIREGTVIGTYEGEPTDIDDVYVLWVEDDVPDVWRGIEGTGVLRFLNHSRRPNVEFDGPSLSAVRDISADEELLFDYGAEWAHIP